MARPLGRRVLHQPWVLRQAGIVPGAPSRPITIVGQPQATAIANRNRRRGRGASLRQDGFLAGAPLFPITLVTEQAKDSALGKRQQHNGRVVRGVRQDGIVPGNPIAPITVVELQAGWSAVAHRQRNPGSFILRTGILTTPDPVRVPNYPITVVSLQAGQSAVQHRQRNRGASVTPIIQGPGIDTVPPIGPITNVDAARSTARAHAQRVTGAVVVVVAPPLPDTTGVPTHPVSLLTQIALRTSRAHAARVHGRIVLVTGPLTAPVTSANPTAPVQIVTAVAERTARAHLQRTRGEVFLRTQPFDPPRTPGKQILLVTRQANRSATSRKQRTRGSAKLYITGVGIAAPVVVPNGRGWPALGTWFLGGFNATVGSEISLTPPTSVELDNPGIAWFVLTSLAYSNAVALDNDGRTGFYRNGPMSDFFIKQHDLLPPISGYLQGADGARPNLTGASVLVKVRNRDTGTLPISAAVTITDAINAAISYSWTAPDTASVMEGELEFEVTFSNGKIQSFPNPGFIRLHITTDNA